MQQGSYLSTICFVPITSQMRYHEHF